jgi:hypothetical protein
MQIQMDGGLRLDWDVHNTDHLAQHDVHPEEAEQALSGDVLTLTIVLPKTVKSAGRLLDKRLRVAFSQVYRRLVQGT